MDENHVMVKVDSLAQLQSILMRTMPDTYVERRERILRAAASVFGDRQKMDEYASIDHERNRNLSKAIEEDGNASEFRKAVQDNLKLLREKPAAESIDRVYEITLRVAFQRHQAGDTKEKARSGDITDLHDTYAITDVCADMIVSPLFSGSLSANLTDFERKALTELSGASKKVLKNLKEAELKEMAGGALNEQQMNILSGRLKAIKALL